MDNVDKVSLLKELEFYSRLLKQHQALRKEKDLKSAIVHKEKLTVQPNKPKSFHSYKVVKNQSNATSCFNQKYSYVKKPSSSNLGIADQNKGNGLFNQRQNFNAQYSFSKNRALSNVSSVNKYAISSKNVNNVSTVNAKLICNSKNEPYKVQSVSNESKDITKDFIPKVESKNRSLSNVSSVNKYVINSKNVNNNVSTINAKSISKSENEPSKVQSVSNGSKEITYNAKDFIKEVESLTKLLKKKTSENSHKHLDFPLKSVNITKTSLLSNKKDKNSAFDFKKENTFHFRKVLALTPSKLPSTVNYVNKRNFAKRNSPHQKIFKMTKSVYKKDNVKSPLNKNAVTSLKKIKTINETKDESPNTLKPRSRKVIFSDSKKLSHDLSASVRTDAYQIKTKQTVSTRTPEFIMKLHMPSKVLSSNRKVIKKSPHINKMKSPVLLKITPNSAKAPKNMKLKRTNSRYTKINKHLISSNRKISPGHHHLHKSSLRKIKKQVSSKYKVINKTITPSSSKKTTNSLSISLDKKKPSLSTECDNFLEALNNSAVDKLERNLLVMSSELTAPLSAEKKNCTGSIIHRSLPKVGSKMDTKKMLYKKSASRVSKYKIINSNASQKRSVKKLQSIHIVTPLKREKAVLVRRLFKSKNVLINKNASPTSYSAKMIKSKYLSLNKRKSPKWQKNVYPSSVYQPKFKGPYFSAKLHHKQKRFRNSAYPSRLIRKTHYGWETNKGICKNIQRQVKYKTNSRFAQTPVVFIRGTKYAMNLNGKTLRKLPFKGHTAKYFQRATTRLVQRAPEIWNKTSPASTSLANRALHRSINRILTATSKKKLSKVNIYCMFYNRFGRCNRGVKCTYIHDPSKIAVCTRFLRGTCKIDGCPFSHEVDPGKMAICSFFLVGQCDKENCPYRHEKLSPNAALCKDFVQGYCHYGKECKKAHILICPKYMQGECDKGSSCAFPHPPQKPRKNIQKEVEDEETKPTEVLLEKVLRYFQQGGDSEKEKDENNVTNLFVPKQRKLEEQPSFIPLSN